MKHLASSYSCLWALSAYQVANDLWVAAFLKIQFSIRLSFHKGLGTAEDGVELSPGGLLGKAITSCQPLPYPELLLRVECAQSLRHEEQSQIFRPRNWGLQGFIDVEAFTQAYNNLDGNCGLTLVKVQGNNNRELLHSALHACPVPTHSNSCSLLTAHCHILGAQSSQPERRLQLINNSGYTALRCSREVLPVRAATKFVWCNEGLRLVLQGCVPVAQRCGCRRQQCDRLVLRGSRAGALCFLPLFHKIAAWEKSLCTAPVRKLNLN